MPVATSCQVSTNGRALEIAQRLLLASGQAVPSLPELLAELAECFQATGAALAAVPGGVVAAHGTVDWQPEALDALRKAPLAQKLVTGEGQTILAVLAEAADAAWVLWVETSETAWSDAEAAALTLVGQAVARRATDLLKDAAWEERRQRRLRQRRMEEAAFVARRLAHDFGNVLTGILGFSELTLARPDVEPVARQHISEVYQAAQHGAHWVHNLRLFSRRGAGGSGTAFLKTVLAEESNRLRQQGTSATLRVELSENLLPVALDPDALRQVIGALVDNARDAMHGQGTITVASRTVQLTEAACQDYYGGAVPGPAVEVTIADTGCGMTPEVKAILLAEPFFSTKPRHRGLGLCVVYGVLQAYRGGFRLEEGPEGRGTTVRVVLPTAAVGATPVVAARPAVPAGQGEKVLVVDDDPLILNLVCTTLERAGYRVQPASSGAEALASYEAAGSERFGLVLSDVLMPQMTGVDLVRHLLEQHAKVNVLFMSGHVSEDFAHQNLHEWQFDLLPKPFRPDGLLRAVRAALDRGPRPVPDALPCA